MNSNKSTNANPKIAWNPKKSKTKKCKIMSEVLTEYSSNATLHGVQYIGAKDKSLIERIWWAIIFLISTIICGWLINQTWLKWKENPIIISFETKESKVSDIPFPAVTICPYGKVNKTVYNYSYYFENRNNLNKIEYRKFCDISMNCNLELYENYNCTYSFTDEQIIYNIKKVASKVSDVIIDVKYNFVERLTSEGICYTFNSLRQDEIYSDQINHNISYMSKKIRKTMLWSIDTGYQKDLIKKAYPIYFKNSGRFQGLYFSLLSNLSNFDEICGNQFSGYKIILHHPYEIPNVEEVFYFIPSKEISMIEIKPEMIKSDDDVQSLPISIRSCYFLHERNLRFFKYYTPLNCVLECLTNATLKICNCVSYDMPRNNNTPVCGFRKIPCLKIVKKKIFEYIQKMNTDKNILNKMEKSKNFKAFKSCNCLELCNNLYYDTKIQYAEYSKGIAHQNTYENVSNIDTTVYVYFENSKFVTLKRSQLYGQTDFLSNCGGLLGLFLGFSVLSLVEIIYFLTIRVWFKVKNRYFS